MAKTAFICIIVAIASIVLTKDTRKLLLKPIEKMINKVKGISNNPLRSVQSEEYESYLQELRSRYLKTLKSENRPIEVIILEETVQKIGALLALGFGESGSEIIAYNIERSGGHIDPLIPGRRTYCIFGSCEILDFSAISNILSKEITYFVNEISFIVHNIADQFSGYANRNTGENMIIVWKFPDDCIDIDPFTEQKRGLNNNPYIKEIADMAVIGFVKILIEVSKNQRLLKYKNHDKIALKMPNYEVKLNLSLHQGWGIEGAIGSEFKLDADYISPDLNIASRLNSLTNDYKVPIIISGDLEKICSNVTRSKFRKIDRIKLNSTKDPKALYTCYLNLNLIGHPPIQNTAEANNSKRLRVLGRLTRDKLKELTRKGNYKTSKLWSEDYDLRMATIDLNPEFTEVYNEALNFYIHGD